MINRNMRNYDYFTFGEVDSYGQQKLSNKAQGSVKMAIYTTGQSVQDNILYNNAQYIGLTYNKDINDKYVIEYNDIKLKVLYVSAQGRLNSVFMSKVE